MRGSPAQQFPWIIEYKFMQQLSPRPVEGFEQTEEDHLTSKQRDRNRETYLYYKIPEAKPLLSKLYIDYSKPKVLIKQIKISKEPLALTQAILLSLPHSLDRPQLGRKQEFKTADSTLWKRYIMSNNYRCIYIKYLNPLEEFQQKGKKLRHQLLKMTQNREHLFATYIMDINFLTEGGAVQLMRNLEESSFKEERERVEAMQREYEFDSRVECGNLMYVLEMDQSSRGEVKEFHLILQNDINTKGYGNWFYFKFYSKFKGKYRFHIVNIQKNYSFFGYGMRPAVFSLQKAKHLSSPWHYDGYNIVYQRNDLIKDDSSKIRYNTLSFTYEQTHDDDLIYFSAGLPYSYSKLVAFLDAIEKTAKSNNSLYIRREALAATLSSNECPLLTITWKRDKKKEEHKSKKKIVLILARQHPSEIVSSYLMEGMINQLIQCGQSSIQLLKRYIFKIVPMVNIDGVIYGNSRCDITGSDANRKWTKNPNQFLYPIITAIKKMVSNLTLEGYEIDYFIDLHGHSRKLGSFIYACKNYDEIESRMFPWIMSKLNNKFSFQNCRFGISNFRKETARGYMMNIASNRRSMTVQTSFFGYKSPNGLKPFETEELHGLGASLIEAIHIDTFRNSKLINWSTVKHEIKATIHNRVLEEEGEEESSGSDSNPEIDQLSLKEKVDTFLSPAAATKLGLIDVRVVEKARRDNAEGRQINLLEGENFSNHQVFSQDYDTILNQKYLQSQDLLKPDKLSANTIKTSKSVTKLQPFRFKSLEKKPLSLSKKIQIAIDIQRIEKKEQRLATPSLPAVVQRHSGKEFWSNLKKEYEYLLNQKKTLLQKTPYPHPLVRLRKQTP